MNQYILIDANIARSCTDPARHATSAACLRLTQVLQGRHCLVGVALSPLLREEWKKHASPMFIKWWANMESRRRIREEPDVRLSDYRRHVEELEDAGIREAMIKDAHLVELSMHKHYPIASQDDKQARYVADIASVYALARSIQWFNPVTSDAWIEWILGGCQDSAAFLCGKDTQPSSA